jgi:hypothetical protein
MSGRIHILAAGALFSLVLVCLTWRMVRHLHVLGSEEDSVRWGMTDFRDVIYFPTRAVLEGINPYDSEPNSDTARYHGRYPVGNVFPVYSPLLMVLDAPLQLLPYHVAMAAYVLFNVALLLVVANCALRFSHVNCGIAATLILATLMLLSRPGQSNFNFGQLALPMVLCAMVATEWSAKRPGWAAIALALASIKPTFGAPLLILIFSQRRWKAAILGGGIGGSLAVLGFALIFSVCHSGKPLLQTLKDNLSHTESDPGFDARKSGIRLDAVAVVERLAKVNHSEAIKVIVPLSILAISAVVLWMLSHVQFDRDDWISSPLIMLTTLLCVFHAAYDGLLLTLPILSLAFGRQMPPQGKLRQAIRWLLVGLLLVPALNVFSSRQFLQFLDPYLGNLFSTADDGWLWTLASILNGLSLLMAWLILVLTAGSRILAIRQATSMPPSVAT